MITEVKRMVPLAVVAQQHGWPYRRALDAVLTRELEAQRVKGRWFVIVRSEAPEAA